jgi:hypothetical protein
MSHEKANRLPVPIFLYVSAAKYLCSISSSILVGTRHHGDSIDPQYCFIPHRKSQRMEVST